VRPGSGYAFHIIESDQDDLVTRIKSIRDSDVRINGGFFIFRQQIFDYIQDGEELVVEPFSRLAGEKQLIAHPWDGFWQCMDTFKDKQVLEDLAARDDAPWQVWTKR
jgi:glucose-1-phosphate cytidylyltransferase